MRREHSQRIWTEGWGRDSALSPEDRAVAGRGRTPQPYVSSGCVSAAAAPKHCSATAGDAAQTQRSPWRTHPKKQKECSCYVHLTINVKTLNFRQRSSCYLRVLLDRALELYRFGDGDDPFESNLLLFHSIRRKVEVWTLITKEEKGCFSRGRSNLFIG